jgi:hypothetical protein
MHFLYKRYTNFLVASYNPNLTEILFSTIASTRENIDPNFPIKKALLVLWKSILFISDGLKTVKSSKKKMRESFGLETKSVIAKSTPQEFRSFQDEIILKYPGYTPPASPLMPLALNATSALSKAMGYAKATEATELLYQTLFPPKTQSVAPKRHYLLQDYYANQNRFPMALPLTHTGLDIPKSIKEAGDIFISNMHVSLGNFQMIQERTKGLQKWQNSKRPHYEDKHLNLIENIYVKKYTHLQIETNVV